MQSSLRKLKYVSPALIVTLTGLPGAGKSTQINILRQIFSYMNYTVITLNIRRSFTATILEKFLLYITYRRTFKNRKFKFYNVYPLEFLLRCCTSRFSRIVDLWSALNLLEILIRYISIILFQKTLGKKIAILIEDGLPAIALDYIYVYTKIGLPIKTAKLYLKSLLYFHSLMKKNSIIVVLEASLNTLFFRWIKRGRGEISTLFLAMHSLIPRLLKILDPTHSIIINTSHESTVETAEKILKKILQNKLT